MKGICDNCGKRKKVKKTKNENTYCEDCYERIRIIHSKEWRDLP